MWCKYMIERAAGTDLWRTVMDGGKSEVHWRKNDQNALVNARLHGGVVEEFSSESGSNILLSNRTLISLRFLRFERAVNTCSSYFSKCQALKDGDCICSTRARCTRTIFRVIKFIIIFNVTINITACTLYIIMYAVNAYTRVWQRNPSSVRCRNVFVMNITQPARRRGLPKLLFPLML